MTVVDFSLLLFFLRLIGDLSRFDLNIEGN